MGSLTIDPAQCAVIVVDMQNDFGAKGGMFALAGIDISAMAAARRADIGIVYLKMAFRLKRRSIKSLRDRLLNDRGRESVAAVTDSLHPLGYRAARATATFRAT
jgi:nicotinamidase-related amidase